MTEERIDKLIWEIHTKADAKRILLAVAAESRKEGIEELLQYATERKIDIRGSRYVALNIVEGGAERLKKQGK